MTIPMRQEKLDALLAKYFSDNDNIHSGANGQRQHSEVDLTDDEMIAKARKAKNSAKFERLFDHGDIIEYDNDDSRADLALLSILAFYSQDPDQLDRLFRRSALCRDKWFDRPDYRRRSIAVAINELAETYGASSSSLPHKEDDDDDVGAPLTVKSFRTLPKPDAPRTFRVANTVPERFVTTLYGEGGSAKSIIALSIALACARGDESWLDFKLKPCPALYVDWELDEEEQSRRARQLARALGDDEPPEQLYYLCAVGHTTRTVLDTALAACKEYSVGLVIIDSTGLAMEGDPAASQDVIRFFRALDRFRAEGATVVLIDHQAKVGSGESYQHKTAFGSVYKGHLSRSRLQVEVKERGRGGLGVVVRQNKANFVGYVEPFRLKVTFSEAMIALERETLASEELAQERTLNVADRILLTLSDGPAFPEDLAEFTGAAVGTVGNALTSLKRRGLVEPTEERRGKAQEVQLTDKGERYVREYLEDREPSSPSLPLKLDDGDDGKSDD